MSLAYLTKATSTSGYPYSAQVNSQPVDDLYLLNQGFTIAQKIGEGNFSVYQVFTRLHNKCFVIKEFPYCNCNPDPYYQNEARFTCLKHPNIINMICRNDRQDLSQPHGGSSTLSYIIMEYAPYGDFCKLIMDHGDHFDDKVVRTYFRQLIEGLEFLHANHVAHLDLKPENLLLSADFTLKITDFDVSYVEGDKRILSDGTMSYRCPEMCESCSKKVNLQLPFAADIYSAGILLFILKSGGVNPYFEDRDSEDIDLLSLMKNDNVEFWKQHYKLEGKPSTFYDQDFIELFNGMTRTDPSKRFTIQQIKNTQWYKGPTYSGPELQKKMTEILSMKPDVEHN